MDGVSRIDRVAALFDVWLDFELLPFAKMKVKVLERSGSDFLAVTNLHRRNADSHEPEYLSGLGDSIDSATTDLLKGFVNDLRKHLPGQGYDEEDFEWSATEDF